MATNSKAYIDNLKNLNYFGIKYVEKSRIIKESEKPELIALLKEILPSQIATAEHGHMPDMSLYVKINEMWHTESAMFGKLIVK